MQRNYLKQFMFRSNITIEKSIRIIIQYYISILIIIYIFRYWNVNIFSKYKLFMHIA